MKNIILFSWLAALLLSLPAMTHAQTWTASAPEDGGTYYLYNVGHEAFMYGHNDWETRASLTKEGGIPFTLAVSGEAYSISSSPTYQNRFLGYDGSNAYVDVESGNANYRTWKFIPVDGQENTYFLQETSGNYYIIGHNSDATKTSSSATQPTSNLGYWKLVTKADLIASMASADADHPVDATWAFQNAYVGRNTDVSCWHGSPSFNGVNNNWCFEKYNTTFDVYQEIEGMPNGVYTLKCQGFYRMGGRTNAATNRNAGTEALNAKYYINGAEGSLKSIFDYSRATAFADGYNENTTYTVGGTAYYLPNTHAQGANNCRKDEYWNDPIRVVVTDGKLRIGVKKTVAVESDWTIFDNFVLTYYGIDMTAMLEQSMTTWHAKYDAIVNQAADHSAFDAVLAAAESYCTTEDKLAEYDGIVWQAVCDVLRDPDNANIQFDITPLIENPTFDTGVGGWDIVGTTNYSGTNGVAEFWNQSSTSLTQTLANMPEGTYTLKAQAFYRSGGWREATYRYSCGTDAVKGHLLLAGQQQDIWNVYDLSRFQPADIDGVAGGAHQGMASDNMKGSHNAFDLGLYWNQLVTTTTTSGNLTLGIGIEDGLAACWMPFDNFRLYYGAASVPVDLSSGLPTEDTQASTVTTGITLNAGEYNRVCLPFDLDATQTAAAFTQAYTLAGVTHEGVGQLLPAYTIEAGKAYFVTVDATKTLSIDSPVRIRVAKPDSIPVLWEGAATVGKFDGFTFDVNLSDGYTLTSYAPVDFQNMSFTVNQENWRARRFLNEFTYDENTASKIRAYNEGHPVRLDQPHSVFIPVPQNHSALTVTVSTNSNYGEAETFAFAAGTLLCEVPNLIPQNTYYYKVEAGGTVLTKGQFQTEGHLRMIKANTAFNIRDLGGLQTLDGNRLRYGRIFRGGDLNYGHTIAAADLAELRRLGIGAELDFRYTPDTNNETPTASALGNDAAYLFLDQTYQDASPTNYISDKDIYRQAFLLNLEQLRQGVATYFHCRIGADRTGAYALLVEGLCGVTLDPFAKDYELTSYSEAGAREWNQPGFNLLGKLADINSFPGKTLQQRFFYYMNHELGIPAADLLDFISLMVDGESSIASADLAFSNEDGLYLQTLDAVTAICADGFVVVGNAKAQLSDGDTTTDIDMTIDGIAISFSGAALETDKTYTLTIPAGALQKDGVENAADATLMFYTPCAFDGLYYLYNPYYDGFIGGGQAYGTSVVVDNYGIPFEWKVDARTGSSQIRFIDNDTYLYGDTWVFIDGTSDDAHPYRPEPSTDDRLTGYYLHALGLGDDYLYTRKPDKSSPRACATNGSVEYRGSDCCTWQFWTKAQHDSYVAHYPTANIEHVITAAGVATTAADFATYLGSCTAVDRSAAVGTTTFGTSKGNWTYTAVRGQDGYPDYGSRNDQEYARVWAGTGTHSVTIAADQLPAGIYKVSVEGFLRHSDEVIDIALAEAGYTNISAAYLKANDEQVQFTSWYEMNKRAEADGQASVYTWQSLDQQALFVNSGYAHNEVYVYLDGQTPLQLDITQPTHRIGCYIVFNDVRLTQYVPNITIDEAATEAPAAVPYANVTLTRTLQTGIWNTVSLPFSLSEEQISASALNGSTIYAFQGIDGNTLKFQIVNSMEAGQPYLLKLPAESENVVNPSFPAVSITQTEGATLGDDGGVQFVAQIYNKSLENVANVCYLSTEGKVKKLKAGGSIKGLRSYFIVPDPTLVKFLFDDTPTGIQTIDNGQWTIDNGTVYDLQGRRVQQPTHGLYIIGGRKIFVK